MKYWILVVTSFLIVGCSKPTAEQLFEKGQQAQVARSYDEALTTFQELISLYPDSAKTQDAYYAIGYIYQNYKNEPHSAVHYYRLLVEKYPDHPTASNAAFLIGFIYANDFQQYDSARIAYEYFLQHYPNSSAGLLTSARYELENLGKDPSMLLSETKNQQKKNTQKKK
ncbi:MAG TPA: tetratricopeptide repeat protein [Bacteroidota bacterium]|nr:tetratricopeptide repeat protein [Bacteroidota bacterium]